MSIIFGLLLVGILSLVWYGISEHLKEKIGVAKTQVISGIVVLFIMVLPWMMSTLVSVHIAHSPELGSLSALFAAIITWMILDGFYHQKKEPRMYPT